MNDKIKINLQIADTFYPLTIDMEEEEMIREAAKQVNLRLNAYRTRYPAQSKEQLISMVAYEFSLETLKQKDKNNTLPYANKINELKGLLEDYFKTQD